MSIQITNKEKQFFDRNFQEPKKGITKANLNWFDKEIPVHGKRKKSKIAKKPFRLPDSYCPFCEQDLPELPKEEQEDKYWIFRRKYVKVCLCGARVIEKDCPACKKDVWFKDGIYKHHNKSYSWCTFEGERKILKEEK